MFNKSLLYIFISIIFNLILSINISESYANNKILNVIDYGAYGDGIHDDTEIIQKLIDSLKDGGTIYFPKGLYKITKTIKVQPYVFLKGSEFIADRDYNKNTSFLIYTEKGNEDIPAFKMYYSSGISGFTIYYPEQVSQNSQSPIVYGYTFESSNIGQQNCDNLYIENIMLLNSYNGIKIIDAGRFNLSNIYGNPIKTGLYINNIFDVSRVKHIHFWPFSYPVHSNIHNWISNNGVAYKLGKVDQFNGYDMFAYGYNKGFVLENGFWGDLVSPLADQCKIPIFIDNINILKVLGGTFISQGILYPNLLTSKNVSGRVQMIGSSFFGGSSIAVLIESDSGSINFISCDFKSQSDGSDGWRWSPLIVSGNANVSVTGSQGLNKRQIFGSSNLSIDGVNWLPKDELLNIKNFDFSNWVDSKPIGWNIFTNNIKQEAKGIKLILRPNQNKSNFVNFIDFPIPRDLKDSGDLLVLSFNYKSNTNNTAEFRFFIKICNILGVQQAIEVGSNYALISKDPINLNIPIYIGKINYDPFLRIEWQAYNDVEGELNLTNFKLYKSSINNLSNFQIENLVKNIYLDPSNNGLVTIKKANKKSILID